MKTIYQVGGTPTTLESFLYERDLCKHQRINYTITMCAEYEQNQFTKNIEINV